MTAWMDMTHEAKIRACRARIGEQMDAIGARDIAQIRASTITGGPACADCGLNTVHGRKLMGAWHCRDTETCDARKAAADIGITDTCGPCRKPFDLLYPPAQYPAVTVEGEMPELICDTCQDEMDAAS